MKRIGLIACSKTKAKSATKAENLYQGALFKKALRYLKDIEKVDEVYILSALHGLLPLDKIIEPYNETLNGKSKKHIKLWTDKVLSQLKEVTDLQNDEFIITAGRNYNKFLIENLTNFKLPLKDCKGLGLQLHYLSDKLKEV